MEQGAFKSSARKMPLRQRWKQTSLPNKLMVGGTGIMAVATLGLLVAAVFQYLAARQQSIAAQEQAKVSKVQADLMQRQLDSMNRQLDSMNMTADETKKAADAAKDSARAAIDLVKQNEILIAAARTQAEASMIQANISKEVVKQNERLVGASETQAVSSQRSVEVSERQFELTARPQIGVASISFAEITADKPAKMELHVRNTGTFPTQIRGGWKLTISPFVTIPEDYTGIMALPSMDILPSTTKYWLLATPKGLNAETVQRVMKGDSFVFVFGYLEYESNGKPYPKFFFCSAYDHEAKRFFDCRGKR